MTEYLKNLFEKMESGKQLKTIDDFNNIVKSFNMTCKWSLSESKGSDFILETWFNKEFPLFAVTRVYDVDSELFDLIPDKEKLKLLNSLLEKEVYLENYERAAVLRDKINFIK